MLKAADVYSDDPLHPKKQIFITGFVERFADIQPRGIVRLIGYLGSDIKRTVIITPEKKYPFEIKNISAKDGKDFAFELKEKQANTEGYVLTITNKKKDKGRYYDTLFIDTDSKVKPTIPIRIFGDVREKPAKKQPVRPSPPHQPVD